MGENGERMLLTGTFERSIDQKLRVALPKQLREALAARSDSPLFVAPGTDGSLAIYHEASFDRLASQLMEASPTARDARAFRRLFYAQTQKIEVDRQGRIRISSALAAIAGLSREAVLVGVGDHVELWDKQRWQDYLSKKQASYDEIAEAAFESG